MSVGTGQAHTPAYKPDGPVTTETIQKLLDENRTLILAVLENQNLGRLAECSRYQARLQQNLIFLAMIADDQPGRRNKRASDSGGLGDVSSSLGAGPTMTSHTTTTHGPPPSSPSNAAAMARATATAYPSRLPAAGGVRLGTGSATPGGTPSLGPPQAYGASPLTASAATAPYGTTTGVYGAGAQQPQQPSPPVGGAGRAGDASALRPPGAAGTLPASMPMGATPSPYGVGVGGVRPQSMGVPSPYGGATAAGPMAGMPMGATGEGHERPWTPDENRRFIDALRLFGLKGIDQIAASVQTRSKQEVQAQLHKYIYNYKLREQQQQQAVAAAAAAGAQGAATAAPAAAGPGLGQQGGYMAAPQPGTTPQGFRPMGGLSRPPGSGGAPPAVRGVVPAMVSSPALTPPTAAAATATGRRPDGSLAGS